MLELADNLSAANKPMDQVVYLQERRRQLGAMRSLPPQCSSLFDFMMGELPTVCTHCLLTAHVAREFAGPMGLSEYDQQLLVSSALLHDIGKIFVPREIVLKPTALSDSDRAAMVEHVRLGERYVSSFAQTTLMATVIGQHHERFDGLGYPYGLCGENINPISRALSVVDAFCAMIENRGYRPSLSIPAARMELRRCAGTQFDPAAVEAFVAMDMTHIGPLL